MKKLFVIVLTSLILAGCQENDGNTNAARVSANDNTKVKTSALKNDGSEANAVDPTNITEVQWLDNQEKDYGKINEGQMLEVSFKFKNTGTKPLVISRVWAQCGCTVPETPQKPYAPGEEGVIKATFNSAGKSGMNTKKVYMQANTNPSVNELTFHVEVSPSEKN